MTAVRRYAQGTTVTVEKSRAEMSTILSKHGCQRMGWFTSPEGDGLEFELQGNRYRFTIPHPMNEPAEKRTWVNRNSYIAVAQQAENEWKRRWRAHVMLLKVKLEFVAGGDSTLEQEFMPNLLVQGGERTLAEWLESGSGTKLIGAGA